LFDDNGNKRKMEKYVAKGRRIGYNKCKKDKGEVSKKWIKTL